MPSNEERWEARLEELKEFRRERGHCDVPNRHPGGLGKWVSHQRKTRRKGWLDARRICKLDEEGFRWAIVNYRWDARLEELQEFRRAHGHCNVHRQHPGGLGEWVSHQRKVRRKGWLDASRIRKLDEEGFRWAIANDRWDARLEELQQFRRAHGHCYVPRQHPGGLGLWVNNQRRARKQGKGWLDARRIQLLEDEGFQWRSRGGHGIRRAAAGGLGRRSKRTGASAAGRSATEKEREAGAKANAALKTRQTALERSLAAKDQELASKEKEIASRDEAIAAVEARQTVLLKALNETLMTKTREINSLTACLERKRQVDIVDLTLDETEPNKRPQTDTTAKSSLAILHKQNQKMIEIKREKNAAETALKNVREEKAAVEADLNEAREQNQKMVEIKREKNAAETALKNVREEKAAVEADLNEAREQNQKMVEIKWEKNATETALMSVREEKAAVEADLQEVKDKLENANTLLHEILIRNVL